MKRWLFALALIAIAVQAAFPQARNEIPAWKLILEDRLVQRASLAVQGAPLTEVLQILRETLKVNIILDASDPTVGDKLITINIQEMPGDKLLYWVTKQAGLEYSLANEAVYIGTAQQTRRQEPGRLVAYEVTDVLLTPEALAAIGGSGQTNSSTNSSSSSNNTSGNNNNNSGNFSSANAANDLMALIVTFTGKENWDQVVVLGASNNNNSTTDNTSKENLF